MPRDITIVLKGNYTDREVKKAIRDLQSLQKEGPKTAKATSLVSTSFKGLAIGVGAGAVLGGITRGLINMGAAAMEDEKSMVALSTAMANVGMRGLTDEAEALVEKLMLQTGVADDQLRPALQRLVTATGDLTQSQTLLQLALDISAATGKDVVQVSQALARASSGQVSALTRLGVPLDANIVKSKDFDAAVASLSSRFRGQAAAAADTYGGRMQRLNVAAGEAGETIGYSLVDALDKVSSAFGGTDGAVGAVTALGDATANVVTGIGDMTAQLATLIAGLTAGEEASTDWGDVLLNLVPGILKPTALALNYFGDQGEKSADAQKRLSDQLRGSEALYAGYAATLDANTDAEQRRRDALEESRSSADRLKDSLDKLYGGNRSVMSQRISLREGFREGPSGTMVGEGKNRREVVSRDDVLKWAISQAGIASSLAGDLYADGKKGKALAAYQQARGGIADTLSQYGIGDRTLNRIMGPAPKWLREDIQTEKSRRGAAEWRENAAPIYINQVVVNTPNPREAVEQAKRWARQSAAGRGLPMRGSTGLPNSAVNPVSWGGIQ